MEDDELKRAIAMSLQSSNAVFDESGVKAAIEKLGHHANKQESEIAIKTLTAYARNILENPGVDKFRHIKTTNAALVGRVLNTSEGREVMNKWGWRAGPDPEHISLPHEVTAHDTRIVLSALDDLHLTEEQRRHKLVVEEQQRKIREREKAEKAERERIRHQLELDRQEMAGVHHRDSHATTSAHPGMHRLDVDHHPQGHT